MPNIKSAIKRVQVSHKQNERNTAARSALKTSLRNFEEALSGKSDADAATTLLSASRSLDKAVSKGLIHKNKAARKKSRIAKRYAAASPLT
jgi:small subunit ribosomal protein S20